MAKRAKRRHRSVSIYLPVMSIVLYDAQKIKANADARLDQAMHLALGGPNYHTGSVYTAHLQPAPSGSFFSTTA